MDTALIVVLIIPMLIVAGLVGFAGWFLAMAMREAAKNQYRH